MAIDFTQEFSKKIKDMASSELSGSGEGKKNIKNYLSEEGSDERNSPNDFLKNPKDMGEILKLVKNKKLSANKIKSEIRKFLKDSEELKDFLRSILEKGKKSEQKEMTGTGSSGQYSQPLFSGEEPKKVETKEATTSASSGQYSTNKIWAKSTSKKDWGPSRKTQIPGGKFVQVKKKCKRFPYCNQGDIKALNIFENQKLKNVIQTISEKYELHEDFIKEIISNEIVKRNNR
jgi:hypothetical protein